MIKKDFLPVKKDHCNFIFKAPVGMDSCVDLNVTRDPETIYSVWKLGSIVERIKFLFRGEITLSIHGWGMPPVALSIGDLNEKN